MGHIILYQLFYSISPLCTAAFISPAVFFTFIFYNKLYRWLSTVLGAWRAWRVPGWRYRLCLNGAPLTIRNLADAPSAPYHYLWSTGDTGRHLRVLELGRCSLQVRTGPLGCSSTDEIVVTKDCYTDIPNAFTPNGDGQNDYFFSSMQLSKGVTAFKMQVFTRWGQLVFETNRNEGRGRDGRFNDKEQPIGVYLYLMELNYSNGQTEQYEGNVTLTR